MYLPFLSLLSQKVYLTFEGTVPAENANKKLRLAGEQCKVTEERLWKGKGPSGNKQNLVREFCVVAGEFTPPFISNSDYTQLLLSTITKYMARTYLNDPKFFIYD